MIIKKLGKKRYFDAIDSITICCVSNANNEKALRKLGYAKKKLKIGV